MISEIDGAPREEEHAPQMSTAQKIHALQTAGEDYEWYPTTPEIMEAMKKDLRDYLRGHLNDYSAGLKKTECGDICILYEYDRETGLEKEAGINISSFLDIGAGDGRVLDFFYADKKYAVEIARAQADDLIRRGVFIIGRNFWETGLIYQDYSLVFSNPPYSLFEKWVERILYECNFEILYLVMPVRWQNRKKITDGLKRYEAAVIGEFDFSKADREARGKVNLVRVNAPWEQEPVKDFKFQQTLEGTFERFIREHIADFREKDGLNWEEQREYALALKKTPIEQLIDDYETERAELAAAFTAMGKLQPEIIKLMGQDKASMLEIIRKAIAGLKSKYWRAAFDKLEPVNTRMTQKTRDSVFGRIEEFKTLDFNSDNIYSIIIWIINNCNIGILDQIGEIFDEMTSREYIEGYKSNRHWAKSDWRNTDKSWKYENLPPRWKLGLDYRIVINTRWRGYDRHSVSVIDDFIIICRNLGFPIRPDCQPDYSLHSAEQKFYTEDGGLAFTMRYYTGNENAHLKINKRLLMKFNIEVAKIRKWMSDPEDVEEEYGVPKDEAARIWNSGLALAGSTDMKMLGFKEGV